MIFYTLMKFDYCSDLFWCMRPMQFNCIFWCGCFDIYHSGLARSVPFFVPVYIVKISTVCNREVEIWKVFSPSTTRKRFRCLIASFYWFLLQIFHIRFTFTDYLLGLVLVTVQFLLQFKVNFSKNLESGLGTLEQIHTVVLILDGMS